MSLAQFRKTYGKSGSGRFVVSEGVAPATYLMPHEGLPTLWTDDEDDRFEIVIPQGTILSGVANASGDTRLVPANGTATAQGWGDADTGFNYTTGATPTPTADSTTTGNVDEVIVPARSVPIGCSMFNLTRRFDKGTSQGAGWITHGFVEWPLIDGVNSDLAVNNFVVSDHMGRPVKHTVGATDYLIVGKVIETETFATNFDGGLLSYMQLPSDPGALKTVYELTKNGAYKGKLGIRTNLDVARVVGAVRVNLTL